MVVDHDTKDLEVTAAWGEKHRQMEDFYKSRPGDALMVPFKCDFCIFKKVTHRKPSLEQRQDKILLACIRRVVLDSFWIRTSATVINNTRLTQRHLKLSINRGMNGPFKLWGELPNYDHCGYETAITMAHASTHGGRYHSTHTQFNTVCKLRTAYGNFVGTSIQVNRRSIALGDNNGKYQRFSNDTSGSFWFARFSEGMQRRMGHDWRPNKALTTVQVSEMIWICKTKIQSVRHPRDAHNWVIFELYATVCYVLSLRGNEGLLIDLDRLYKHNQEQRKYVIIPLLVWIKGESQSRTHLLPCCVETKSGLQVIDIIMKVIKLKHDLGFTFVPAISNPLGLMMSTSELDGMLHEILEELYETQGNLFPPEITSTEIIRKKYHCFRLFQRGSDTRAVEEGVDSRDFNVVNRWRQIEMHKEENLIWTCNNIMQNLNS